MPNVKNVLVGTVFLSLAGLEFFRQGSPWTIGLLFAAAIYLYALAVTRMSSGGLSDLTDALDFVGNPTRTIADRTVDQLLPEAEKAEGRFWGKYREFVAEVRNEESQAAPAKAFDPDAAIARYLAERPNNVGIPEANDAASAPRPTFGRKGA